jgi:PadR family transcriptional regulator, regulatory protein PadR
VTPRLTFPSLMAFRLLLQSNELAGSDITRLTGIKSGSLYPILERFKKAGWLTSRWEEGNPSALGRPPKHLYHLTTTGKRHVLKALKDLS